MQFFAILVLALLLVNQTVFLAHRVFENSSFQKYLSAVLSSVLINQTNSERNGREISSLLHNPILQQAAKLKADDMANKEYFAHTSPDGKEPWHWLNLVDYKYEKVGENLAVNFIDSQDVTRAWMDSPSHRDNLLDNDYTEIGIATAEGLHNGRKAIYVVQFFGNPKIDVTLAEGKTFRVSIAQAETLGGFENSTLLSSPKALSVAIFIILLLASLIHGIYGLIVGNKKYARQAFLLIIIIVSLLYINYQISPLPIIL